GDGFLGDPAVRVEQAEVRAQAGNRDLSVCPVTAELADRRVFAHVPLVPCCLEGQSGTASRVSRPILSSQEISLLRERSSASAASLTRAWRLSTSRTFTFFM